MWIKLLRFFNFNTSLSLAISFKVIIRIFFINTFLVLVILSITKSFLSEVIYIFILKYIWIYYIYLINLGFRTYKVLKESMEEFDSIQKIKKEDSFPLATFKSISHKAECWSKIIDKKLERLKFYSPLPFLLFGSSLFIEDKPILKKVITILDFEFNIRDFLKLFSIIFLLIYIIRYSSLLDQYKNYMLQFNTFQSEVFKYEEKLLSHDNKIRKIELDPNKQI